ncbi:hypothetical protein ACJMK2_041316 [Sinanodonta woodiana]|uniref:CCHC-type domain-containing protein n=1 Tax=Sinanodonta woodiana TaxID=1069815 RepID=A0ABD3W4Q9_SINWO
MASFLSSNGETILKKYFKTTAEDTLEGRIIRAFREDHVQEIDLSHVVAGLRPNTPTLLALLMARGIDPSQVDTLTYTGRGVRPCSVCGKAGHDKFKCPRQAFIAGGASTSHNADTNPPVQNKQNDQTNQSTHTHSANTTTPKVSYANVTKTNLPYVKNLFINLEEESQIEQETCENSGNEIITNSEKE